MEIVTDIVGNEEQRVGGCVTSLEKTADPVVYQLVRVDDSGKLVPATDDEVMAVEDLLEGEGTDVSVVPNKNQTPECNTNYGCDSDELQIKGSEGVQQDEDIKIGAEVPDAQPDLAVICEKIDVQDRGTLPSSTTADNLGQSGCLRGCSKLPVGLNENESSSSAIGASSKPDFSLLRGEIHLDDLSVRGLQETFRATFGRETSVKDKQWLKRRIIMGLTNSCDFSITAFVVTENKVVKKGKEETYEGADQSGLVENRNERTSTSYDKQNDIHSDTNGMKTESSTVQNNGRGEYADTKGRPAKRVRKPTRRYIEEFSEGEFGDLSPRTVSPVRPPAFDQPSASVCARPIRTSGLDGKCLTRKDSLGGSGVQVPFVNRIRRSRPRENFITLTKIQPSGLGMSPTGPLKKEVASSTQSENESGDNVLEGSLSPRWIQEPLQKEAEVEMESYKNKSDDELATIPNANGGMRRKHHRPWTLSEVVKLVDGVAKYGVGRWSEIKRIAFASYSYRTSVDLKDKWRNLLRASVAEQPARNGMHGSRKQASVPIPAGILSRVRELADIQTHIPLCLSSSKHARCKDSNRNVQETRSGFL